MHAFMYARMHSSMHACMLSCTRADELRGWSTPTGITLSSWESPTPFGNMFSSM